MKLIIAGTRTLSFNHIQISMFLEFFGIHPYDVTQVVSGEANGVDTSGEEFANVYISDKPDYLKKFPADWDKHGKAAGPIRNKDMAQYADALLLIWDGQSRGSKNMKEQMQALNKPIYEVALRKS